MTIVLVSLLCFTGCASTRVMTHPKGPRAEQTLEAGEQVVVELQDGRRFNVTVVQVTADRLITKKNKFKWADIRRIEYRRFSFGKTLGGFAIGYVIVSLVGALLLIHALEDSFDE